MVAAIVALRVGVGLHFYLEGTTKLRDKKPFSGAFFANAKGPLAPMYRRMVWDIDGEYRLDGRGTLAYWEDYAKRIGNHFRFDEKQTKAADKLFKDYTVRAKWYFGSKDDVIAEYRDQLKRRDDNRENAARAGLTSLQVHDARIDADRNSLRGPLLADIDKMWKDVENDFNGLATSEQLVRHGRLPIGKIGRQPLDSEFMDWFMPYFDTIIGLLLIIGLFTRPAAIVAGLFLASVCASQWPGYGGASIYYQFVEMLALFALAAIGAGQFCGLDYVLGGIWRQYRPARVPSARTVPAPSGSVKQGAKA